MSRRAKLWALLAAGTVGVVLVGLVFLEPSPPKRIRLATGQPGGAYDSFGREYQRRLGRLGLHVDVVGTNGSVDNLERLVRGEVDAAFAQGGTAALVPDPDGRLRGLAALYVEPLWVFYRGATPVAGFGDFRGRRVAIGPRGSGTEVVARALLSAAGTGGGESLVNMTSADARRELVEGRLDAAFFVTSYRDASIVELLRKPDLHLLNVRRADAYARRLSYLTPVTLPEGLLDLDADLPGRDVVLLAPQALLVARADLHARAVEQLLKVARAIHGPGSLMDAPNRYPSLAHLDLPVHETAATYLTSGESFLSRTFPYWAVRYLLAVQLLVLPVILVWLPLFRLLPLIYVWRRQRLLRRHYAALCEVEAAIERARTPAEVGAGIQSLDRLRSTMDALSRRVPPQYQRDIYHWRAHVSLVQAEARGRLARLGGRQLLDSPSGPGIESA